MLYYLLLLRVVVCWLEQREYVVPLRGQELELVVDAHDGAVLVFLDDVDSAVLVEDLVRPECHVEMCLAQPRQHLGRAQNGEALLFLGLWKKFGNSKLFLVLLLVDDLETLD